MKVNYMCILVLMIFCLVVPTRSVLAQEKQETIHRVAQLDDVTGEVYVKRGGGLREFPAYKGMSLLEGDFIRTHLDSGVTIVFEQDRTTLGEHTQVYIARLNKAEDRKETVLSQWSGQTWNKVKSLFNADDTYDVETATSIMGVRGTLFTVMINPELGTESLIVLEGQVSNKLMREYRLNQAGQVVSVAEQLNISLATKDREENSIDYDYLVEHVDKRIISAIYYDVLERADEFFEENNHSAFEDAETELDRLLITLQSDVMLESLAEITKAIERTNKEEFQQIETHLEQRLGRSFDELEVEILEKRFRQLEQYEELRARAIANGLSDDLLDSFIEEHGGAEALVRAQQIENIKRLIEEQLENNMNNVIPSSDNGASGSINVQPDRDNQIIRPPLSEDRDSASDPILPTDEDPPPVEEDPPVIDEDPPPVEEDPPVIDEDPPPVEEDPPVIDEDPPPVEEDPPVIDEDPPPVEEDPPVTEEDPPPVEEDPPVIDEDPPPVEEDPPVIDEDPPLEEEDPPLDEDDPVVIPPEVSQLEPIYLAFGHMVETKSINDFLVNNDQISRYQFTGLADYDPSLVEVIFDQEKMNVSIIGKVAGNAEVTVQLIDQDERIEPVFVTFAVYVENILPDVVDIPEEYHDQLLISYDHGANHLHISIKDDLFGFHNGWLINGRSIWPTDSDDELANQLSCSADALNNQIPNQLCLELDLLETFEDGGLSIVPIIDQFEIKVEKTNDQPSFVVRDFDPNGNPIVTGFADGESYLKTWKVTYDNDGVVQTDDLRDYLIALEIGQQSDLIFNRLLECQYTNELDHAIPEQLCLSDLEGILAITAVFSHSFNQNLIIDNEKNVPVETQYLLDGRLIKLSVKAEHELVSRLVEINPISSTKIVQHPENLMEFYLYSDEDIHVSVDFIEVPVEIIVDGSELDQAERVGSIEQRIEFEIWYGMYYLDIWLIAEPKAGYTFLYWLIYWGEDDPELMEHYSEELMIGEFMYSDVEIIVKAVFEEN